MIRSLILIVAALTAQAAEIGKMIEWRKAWYPAAAP
jgi:hypothetical protein